MMPNLKLMGSISPGEHHILKCSPSLSLFLVFYLLLMGSTMVHPEIQAHIIYLISSFLFTVSSSLTKSSWTNILKTSPILLFSILTHIMLLLTLNMSHQSSVIACLLSARCLFPIYLTHCSQLYGTKVKLYAFPKKAFSSSVYHLLSWQLGPYQSDSCLYFQLSSTTLLLTQVFHSYKTICN